MFNFQVISTLSSLRMGVNNRIDIGSINILLVARAGYINEIMAPDLLVDDFHAPPVIVGNHLISKGFEAPY